MVGKILILLLGVAAIASASVSVKPEDDESVQKLNDWLVINLPDNLDPQANLEKTKEAVQADPSLQPAVEALQTLAAAKGCDEDVLAALGLFSSLRAVGRKRIEKVVYHFGSKVSPGPCFETLKKMHQSQAQFDDAHVTALLKRFEKNMFPEKRLQAYLSRQNLDREFGVDRFADALSSDVKAVAGNDPKAVFFQTKLNEMTGKDVTTNFPENYKYAFETYLLKPCQQYTQKTAGVFRGFIGVSEFVPNPAYLDEYRSQWKYETKYNNWINAEWKDKVVEPISTFMPREFQNGLFAYKRCRLIEAYDEATYTKSFNTAQYRDYEVRGGK